MKLKKLVTIVMVTVSVMMFSNVYASAKTVNNEDQIGLYFVIASAAESNLTISGTVASCFSSALGNSKTVKISATQTLEKHWGLWMWDPVANASWTKTMNSKSFTMANSKSGLVNGTYRLKTDFTLTTSSGQSETITVYSSEVTI